MKLTQVVPGSYHIESDTTAAILGSPSEILKVLLKQQQKVPRVGILPDVGHVNGVSQIAFEFLAFWFLFIEQGYQNGQKFRILGTPAMCERLNDIMRVTLLGPSLEEMKSWGLSKSRAEMLATMSDGMALKRGDKILPVEEIFEYVHLWDGDSGDSEAVSVFADNDQITVRRLGNNRFELKDGDNIQQLDLNFEGPQMPVLADFSGSLEKPEKFGVKVLGCYSGFDPSGPTTRNADVDQREWDHD